jgi:Fic family protein
MAKDSDEQGHKAIEAIIRAHAPEGMSVSEIADALKADAPPRRTLQYQLKQLVDLKRLVREGERRGTRYTAPPTAEVTGFAAGPRDVWVGTADATLPLSREAAEIQAYVRRPVAARKPVGYDRDFLDAYRPNETFHLTEKERAHLHRVGTPRIAPQPAGTYAKQILGRLLIDLAWNSSRLEGNTYSLLDTRRLIDLGQEAEGKDRLDAQMILNHKDAIEFLVSGAEEIGFNRFTILNLHALLANNLLADPDASGRLRRIPVGIERSVFHPLELPQLIEECFHELLGKAASISDPFEQAFFVMVQLPYLQPFDDVNKRVSRLAANIPMIRHNLAPLSFTDVPRESYLQAVLGVYELRRTEMLRDVFIWAYERSAARYAAVRQSLGEPDAFRLQYRSQLRELVGGMVRSPMGRRKATEHIAGWTAEHIPQHDRERFRATAEDELLGLHEGNFARYQIRPSEFKAWSDVWNR